MVLFAAFRNAVATLEAGAKEGTSLMVTFLVYHYLGLLVLFWSFLKSLGLAGQHFQRQFGQEICVLHTKRKQGKNESTIT